MKWNMENRFFVLFGKSHGSNEQKTQIKQRRGEKFVFRFLTNFLKGGSQ